MSISAISNRWLNRLYKVLAILLVLFAVLISAFRLFLPYAQNYRQNFQDYINQTYDSNLAIGSLSMGWDGAGPSVIVEQISLLNTEMANIFVARMELTVDFWHSLQYQKLITHDVSLKGAQVFIDQTLLAQQETSAQGNSLINSLSDTFFQQIKRFSLINSKITVRTEKQTRTFLVDQLIWANSGMDHRATGSVLIDGLTANNIKFNLDASGKNLRDLTGQLYFEANKLNITPWLDTVFAIEDEKTDSSVNFSAWCTLSKGKASQLQIALGDNEVSWLYQEELHRLRVEKGNILIDNFDDITKRTITTTPLQFYTNDHAWQPLTVATKRSSKGLLTYISSLELVGLADLYPLFSGHTESQKLLQDLAPVGQINDIYLLNNVDDVKAAASFSGVTSSFSQGIPGIENVSGELSFTQQHLQLELLAENGELDFNKHFTHSIPYQSIAAQVDVDLSVADLSVKVQQIEFVSEQLHVTGDVAIETPEDKTITMALLANIHYGDVKFANYFYPHLLMGKSLVNYLNTAIIDGEIEQGQVLFNGPLDNFPFHDNSGTFIVDVELKNNTFQFDPSWPVINNFAANLNFTNNSMLITGRGGELTGVDVKGVKVAIDDLKIDRVLTVVANFNNTQPSAINTLMNNSPMADTVGKTLNQLQITAPISGNFSLNLPLNDLDSVLASGKVIFDNNQLALQTPAMNFTDINGELTFVNEVINTKNITLNWRKMPMALSVKANDTEQGYYQTLINLQANWPELAWQKELPKLLEKYGSGQLDWQGDLTLKMQHQGGVSYDLFIDSTMEKLAFTLPAPYKKSIGEIFKVTAHVSGQEHLSTINVQVDDKVNFYGELDHSKVQFTKAHLVLGNENMLLPTEGFHITTNLVTASVMEWQMLVFDILDSIEQASKSNNKDSVALLNAPERIRGRVAKLDVLGQTLTDVSFNLLDKEQWWLLDLNAKEARTKAKFYPNWHQQGIDINADFIHLAPDNAVNVEANNEAGNADNITDNEVKKESIQQTESEQAPLSNAIIFANIPPIRAKCASCTFGRFDFGEVDFSIERIKDDTLKVKKFTAKRGKTQMSFDATWQHNQNISQTKVTGKLKAKNVEREIEKLGYSSTVKDSELSSTYKLSWAGSPFDFKLENFNGTSKIKLSDGYLAEVPDKAKAFSILSLQSLVRKLKFDFRDIFSDGMFYDSIKGNFQIKKGVVYTNNTFMKGAAGDLSIKGNVDLNSETLDYKMSYKPNLTSSLPAIAWIATLNPITFIGAVALDGVITSQVVSEYKIEVTGPIEEPVIKVVDKKTQNIKVGRSTPPEIIDTLPSSDNGSSLIPDNAEHGIKDHKRMNIDG
jgi:uncharacterized protein (TIGR02099 family)